jgi:transposase
MGGDQHSPHIEAHGDLILSLYEATPDITLQELRAALAEQGVAVGYGGLWRFFRRHSITVKKDGACGRAGEVRHPEAARGLG